VAHRVIRPSDWAWITRPHEPGEPARHVAELSDLAGFAHTRAKRLALRAGRPRQAAPAQAAGGDLQAELLVYVYGTPPEDENAELLDSAV
jgi:hypothetical protein